LENVFYVMAQENSYTEGEIAVGITKESMGVAENLVGYVFVLNKYEEARNNGVWSYYTAKNMRVALPELVSANQIAYSLRFAPNKEAVNGEYRYEYVTGFEPGTKVNPYVIKNAKRNLNGNIFLNIGDITLIRSYKDKNDIHRGFIHNIERGQFFRIPRSFVK